MRKMYQTPHTTVVKIHGSGIICTSEIVTSVNSNADLEYPCTGSSISARTRENSLWEEEW